MEKEHTNPASEQEELLEAASSVTTPDEQENTDEDEIVQDTLIHQDDEDDENEDEDREISRRRKDDEDHLTIPDILPVLPLKDAVVYPFALQPLGVGQERSIRLIDDVMRGNRLVGLVAQKSAEIEQAGLKDSFRI